MHMLLTDMLESLAIGMKYMRTTGPKQRARRQTKCAPRWYSDILNGSSSIFRHQHVCGVPGDLSWPNGNLHHGAKSGRRASIGCVSPAG